MSVQKAKEPSKRYVHRVFSKYYQENARALPLPSLMEKREFGFFLFKEQIMLRHQNFKDPNELAHFLRNITPLDVYYSCAYYASPSVDMDRKGWLGADLVFDIDADHISHPRSCESVHPKSWPCEICLESTKKETIKLLDTLMEDFGFSERELLVYFSGHRGYHVHVESEAVKDLDALARKEIVDYVFGVGFVADFGELAKGSRRPVHVLRSFKPDDSGWRGRIARAMRYLIRNGEQEDYKSIGLEDNVVQTMVKNRDSILKSLDQVEPWKAVKGIDFETLRKITEFYAKSQSAHVDTVVTTDIHRLIRMAGTLHGKTGLKKVGFPIPEIEDFDPLKRAVAFKEGTVTLLISDAPEFRLGDNTFGPYKEQKIELDTSTALLLICKGRAEVLE